MKQNEMSTHEYEEFMTHMRAICAKLHEWSGGEQTLFSMMIENEEYQNYYELLISYGGIHDLPPIDPKELN